MTYTFNLPIEIEGSNPDESSGICIVFCLPGQTFSNKYLMSWTKLLGACLARNMRVFVSQNCSPVVAWTRAMCLGAESVIAGAHSTPWDGCVKYDYIMWIDHDQVYEPEDFFKLLESPHDVTCGAYRALATSGYPEECYPAWTKGSQIPFEPLTPTAVEAYAAKHGRYIPLDITGMGWMLVRKGVFERIPSPWFGKDDRVESFGVCDMSGEDAVFCRKLHTLGIDCMLDTRVRVGHEKRVVL